MSGTIRYRLEEDDLLGAQSAFFAARLRTPIIAIVVGATILVGIGILVLDPFPGRRQVALLALPFAGLAAGALVLLAPRWGIRRMAKRIAAQNRGLALEQRAQWDEEGIRFSSERGEARLRWSDFHRWQRAPTMILLYLDETQFHPLPLRALAADQADEIVRLVKAAGVRPLGRAS